MEPSCICQSEWERLEPSNPVKSAKQHVCAHLSLRSLNANLELDDHRTHILLAFRTTFPTNQCVLASPFTARSSPPPRSADHTRLGYVYARLASSETVYPDSLFLVGGKPEDGHN